ncbi:Zinc finger protein [Plakobranchus ocellatus]|uniref:Zinc finger protein n=1 Tax=Plakobranchus ocellatus TaxID=259542 RepID=A0AAV3Y177_9GAST|nr:Zinc finger protein [Plakobranchus ocellatus]
MAEERTRSEQMEDICIGLHPEADGQSLQVTKEVPQESTRFAPSELLYERTIRGSIHILRELWTKDIQKPAVKSSYEYAPELWLDDTLQRSYGMPRRSRGTIMNGRRGGGSSAWATNS